MEAKNSIGEKECLLLLETKQKSYSSVSDSGRNYEETFLTNQTFPTDSKRERSYIKEEKPDGGWGWLVVFGVALSNMTTQALISVFGLLFIEKLEKLGIRTKGASLMMGVQITTLNLSGLITGHIIKKFSFRKAALVGAILVVAGLILTTHADSLPEFILTYSLFTGLGLGFLYPATFVAINSFFDKKKGRAVGLSVAGTGLGQMLLPLLVEYLLDVYDFKGTLLILAGMASHSVLGATLFQPVKWHMKRYKILEEDVSGKVKRQQGTVRDLKRKTEGMWKGLCRVMNVELMRSPSFVNLLICLALVYVANMCFSMLLPFFLEDQEYSLDDVAICMCVLSGADILGRLILPIFTDVFQVRCKTIFFVGSALSALARSGLMFTKNFFWTLILAGVCGIFRAALICNFNLAISEQTTPEKLPSALGLHMFFKGIAMLAFAPLIGFVRDYTESYEFCMHILSIFFLALPFASWLLEYIVTKSRSTSSRVCPSRTEGY